MDFSEVIACRRSVRQYEKGKNVTKEEIREMIAAAQMAPSWKNQQTSRYYCVMDKEKLKRFREECLPEFNQKNTENVSAVLVTTFVSDWSGYDGRTHEPVNEVGNGWGFYDLGLQNENLLLKAEEMGVAALVMGIRDADNIRRILQVPDTETIVSVIAMGRTDQTPEMPRRREIDEILKFY